MTFSNDCIQDVGRCAAEIPVLTVTQDTKGTLETTLYTKENSAWDLTDYAPSSSSSAGSGDLFTGVQFKVKALHTDTQPYISDEVDITDPANGVVSWSYNPEDLVKPGMWVAVFNLVRDGVKEFSIPYYLDIRPNLSNAYPHGPITIPEIRIALMDTCGANNRLLDDVEFTDEEIAFAIRRPIDYWNEVPPPVRTYSVATFPFRYHWFEATIGELLVMASHKFRRNHLPYNAAGLSVDDMNKFDGYYKTGTNFRNEYKTFVQNKKVEINVNGAFTTLRSYYPGSGYRESTRNQ